LLEFSNSLYEMRDEEKLLIYFKGDVMLRKLGDSKLIRSDNTQIFVLVFTTLCASSST